MMADLFGERRKPDVRSVAAIRGWTQELFALDVDTTVMVTELQCTEPGCPPVETVIAILERPGQPRQHKVFKPMAEVTRDDVARLRNGEAEAHGHPHG